MKRTIIAILLSMMILLNFGGCKITFPILQIKWHSLEDYIKIPKQTEEEKQKKYYRSKTDRVDEIYNRMFRNF